MSIAATLFDNLPDFVKTPPVECVVFAWGANEDRQLGAVIRLPFIAYEYEAMDSRLRCRGLCLDAQSYRITSRLSIERTTTRMQSSRCRKPQYHGRVASTSAVGVHSTEICDRCVGRTVWYGRGGGMIEEHWVEVTNLMERTVKRRYGSRMFRLFRWRLADGIAWRSIPYLRCISLGLFECGDGGCSMGRSMRGVAMNICNVLWRYQSYATFCSPLQLFPISVFSKLPVEVRIDPRLYED